MEVSPETASWAADEFIGVLFKDVDEGEISYDFHMSILEMDID